MAITGGADQHTRRMDAVMLDHPDPTVNIFGDQTYHLSLRHCAVHSVGKEQGDVLIRHPNPVQFFHQYRDINMAAGKPGNIVRENTHTVSGSDFLVQMPASNGMEQSRPHHRLLTQDCRRLFPGTHDGEIYSIGNLQFQQLFSVFDLIFHFPFSLS